MFIYSRFIVTNEVQAFISQAISCVLQVSYINGCILCLSIACGSIQFIQICRGCNAWCCMIINSRANVVNDGITASCITSCIFERYDYVICSYVITSRTIKICCISTIWAFNNFITIFICINSWGNSVYCVCFLTCCSISSFRY